MAEEAPRLMGVYARETVTWLQHQGLDEYGDPLAPVEVPVPVRITWKVKRVLNRSGEEVISSGHLIMLSQPNAAEDRIRVDGVERQIIAVEKIKGFTAAIGYKVYLQ